MGPSVTFCLSLFSSPFACVTSGPLFPFLSRLLPPFPLASSLLLVLLPRSRLLPPFLFPSSFLFLPPSFFLLFFLPFFLLSPLLSSLPSFPFPSVFVYYGCIRSHFGCSLRDFSSFSSLFLDVYEVFIKRMRMDFLRSFMRIRLSLGIPFFGQTP